MVEALTACTKQPQKQDVRFRQTTAAMLEVLTYTPSIAEVCQPIAVGITHYNVMYQRAILHNAILAAHKYLLTVCTTN